MVRQKAGVWKVVSFSWPKSICKMVKRLRARCAVSSAKYSRKTS